MLRIIIFIALVYNFLTVQLFAQQSVDKEETKLGYMTSNEDKVGIVFEKGTLEDIIEKNGASKVYFLDIYAEWCGPCKRMSKKTFTDKEVGEFFNENFISVKVNWDIKENREYLNKFEIRGLPSLLFVDSELNLIHMGVGMHDEADLIKLGKKALKKNTK